MIAYLKRQKYILFLIIFQMAVFHRWIFQDALFTFGDIGVLTPENQLELLKNALSIYASDTGLGGLSVGSSTNPLLFAFGALSALGIDYIWSMKLILFYPTVFGVVLTSYFLIRHLTRSDGAACIGALVYSYGTYFLITLTGALYLSLAYALAPIILLAGIRLLEYPTAIRRIALALSMALVGYIEFRILYISVWILAVHVLFHCYFSNTGFFQTVRRHVWDFIISGIIFLLLNLFWVLPLLLAGKISSNQLFNRGLFGDSYFDIVNAFALFHPWWTGTIPAIFHRQEASWYFFLPVGLSLMTLFFGRRKKVLSFLFLLLISIFLTKQSGPPFEPFYRWLYGIFPGFNAFREASKFFYLSTFSASILVAYLVSAEHQFSQRVRMILRGLIIVLIAGIGLRAWAVGSDALGTMFIPHEYPEEYGHLNQLIDSRNYGRVLWFPHSNRFGAYSNAHPSWSLLLGMESDFREFIDPTEKNFVESLYSPFNNQFFGAYLRHASVQYVVVPSNLKWDDIKSPWKNSANYVSRLDTVPYLDKQEDDELSRGGITLYKVKDPVPHLYLTKHPVSWENDTNPIPVVTREINATEYRVVLRNLTEPVYLNFSEKFHPDWRLRAGTFRWFDSLIDPHYGVAGAVPERDVFGLTTFVVDPKELTRPDVTYRENTDGSIDVVLTLYFGPQKYFVVGMYVGLGTLILCLFVMVYTVSKSNNGLIKR